MDDPRAGAFGELRGILEAFARFNDNGNLIYEFTVERLPHGADSRRAAADALGIDIKNFVPVDSWETALRAMLGRWLFEYRSVVAKRLIHTGKQYDFVYPGESFYLDSEAFRTRLIDGMVSRLGIMIAPDSAWKVESALSSALVLASARESFMLRFEVSD